MPYLRRKLWLALPAGILLSTVGAVAAESWVLDGVDPFYFATPSTPSIPRLPRSIDVAADPSASQPVQYAPVSPAYASAPAEPAVEASVADANVDHLMREIEADDRRWQARVEAESRREQRLAAASLTDSAPERAVQIDTGELPKSGQAVPTQSISGDETPSTPITSGSEGNGFT